MLVDCGGRQLRPAEAEIRRPRRRDCEAPAAGLDLSHTCRSPCGPQQVRMTYFPPDILSLALVRSAASRQKHAAFLDLKETFGSFA